MNLPQMSERLLIEAGIDEQTAEREACQMEHALSEESFAKLKSLKQQEA